MIGAARCALVVLAGAACSALVAAASVGGCDNCPDAAVGASQICECDEQCPEGMVCHRGTVSYESEQYPVDFCSRPCTLFEDCRANGFVAGYCNLSLLTPGGYCCNLNSSDAGVPCPLWQ
ncbi:MAG: hypothetical protein HY908_20600 [Myxococcales bacterium]|nr:hypothetical protein [Myxococcales bacterium]